MALPLLAYAPVTQNQRVNGYEVLGEESPRVYATSLVLNDADMDELITAAYRQLYHEQQMLKSHRQTFLESQLRFGQISVRDFIRGLALSDSFRRLNYETNSNYRFAQLCVQRILGRDIYNEKEKLAWSIVLATKGLEGFINALLDSEEYLENFNLDTVPFQRRRILPQRSSGELPFERWHRYDANHLKQLEALGNNFSDSQPAIFGVPGIRWAWQRAPFSPGVRAAGAIFARSGGALVAVLVLSILLAYYGVISL
ncbi:MAG: phycobilisome rod-core linker polypeptide [Cyanobacteria bacterium P01_F01_bin.33]